MRKFFIITAVTLFSSSLFADIKVQILSELENVSVKVSKSYQAKRDSFLCKSYSIENGGMIPKIYDIDEVVETKYLSNISIAEKLTKCNAIMISNPTLEFKTNETLFASDVTLSGGATVRPILTEIALNQSTSDNAQVIECKKYKLSNNQTILGCRGTVGIGPDDIVQIKLILNQ